MSRCPHEQNPSAAWYNLRSAARVLPTNMAAAQELNSQAAQLFHRGSTAEAEKLWRRALHVAPAWPDLYANLASALVTRSQPARAEAWLALRAAVRGGVRLTVAARVLSLNTTSSHCLNCLVDHRPF